VTITDKRYFLGIGGCILLAMVSVVLVANQNHMETTLQDSKESGTRISGTITEIDLGCAADGPHCSIVLDDRKRIIIKTVRMGNIPDTKIPNTENGTLVDMDIFTDGNTLIGRRVDAYVHPLSIKSETTPSQDPMYDVYTIEGSKDYYVRPASMSHFLINDISVSEEDFRTFLMTLEEVPGTRTSGESHNGVYSSYQATKKNGGAYIFRQDGLTSQIVSVPTP